MFAPNFDHIRRLSLSHGPIFGQSNEGLAMQTMTAGYQSFSLLMQLNWDRILYVAVIAFALCGGGFIGSLLS